MKKRLWVVYGCIFSLFCGLSFRIYTLSNQNLSAAADKQSSVTITVANTRGTIYDRDGVPFVNNEAEFRAGVIAVPSALSALSAALDAEAFSALSKTLQTGRPAVVTLKKPVGAVGISLFEVPVRYGERVLAPHLIGYMDADETEGLTGLEAAFQTQLGLYNAAATVSYTVDAKGKALSGIPPVINNTIKTSKGGIVLTLDADIQQLAEDITAKYVKKGATVVMNPENGEILAMVSLPTYHPSKVADVLQDGDSPLLNRALCNYNCGSVFKIVSTVAALETDSTTAQQFTCNGNIAIGNNTFHCHHRLGHGALNLEEAFAKSCNCYYIQLMQNTGAAPLYNVSRRLYFGSTIRLCDGIQTAVSTLPSENTLSAPAALANLSFGQGELTASPLHIASLVSTVYNDGVLVSPQIIKGYIDDNGTVTNRADTLESRVFSSETAATLYCMMQLVTEPDGTGADGKPKYGICGAKTGTAETGWAPANGETKAVVHSWFAGYYIPREGEQYVIVTVAENADNTGAKTAPVFKEIAEALYNLKDEE